jgi:CHAT domain-containing protein
VESLEALQHALTPAEAVLAYADTADGPSVFAVTAHSITWVALPPLTDRDTRIEVFNELLNSPAPLRALPVGRALSSAMLEPVLNGLPSTISRLIVTASGAIAGLPVAALPDPIDLNAGRPLLARFTVAYAPSLSALAHLRSAPTFDGSRPVLAVADPDAPGALSYVQSPGPLAAGALGRLPFAVAEARRVAQFAESPTVLVGRDATEATLKARGLDQFGALHFATHAVLDPVLPSRSAIILGRGSLDEDGLLQPREIYPLRLRANLVVLSACSSAAGRRSSAEGLQSLSQAFLYAGARSVAGSLWAVDDRAAADLVERFYAAMAAGLPVAAALRRAQLEIAADRPYERASSWAGFVLQGDPLARPALVAPVLRGRWWLALGGAVLILLVTVVLSKGGPLTVRQVFAFRPFSFL